MKRRSLLAKFGVGIAATGASRLDGGIGGGDLLKQPQPEDNSPEFKLRKDLSTDEYLAVEHQDGSIGYLPTKPPEKKSEYPVVEVPDDLWGKKPSLSATVSGWGYELVAAAASGYPIYGGFSRAVILDYDLPKITVEPATVIETPAFSPIKNDPLAMQKPRKEKL